MAKEPMTSDDIEIKKETFWRFRKVSQHEFVLRREIALDRVQTHFDAMGEVAVFGVCRLSAGSLCYQSDGYAQAVPWREYGIVLPPRSVARGSSMGLHLEVDFLITTEMHPDLPKMACIFPLTSSRPQTFDEAMKLLPPPESRHPIEVCTRPSSLARKVKAAIDASFRETTSFAGLARSLDVSQTMMGRYFKKDYGMTPTAYRNHLRIVSVTLDLISGAEIVDSYQTVGFDDLSQFYKQFKRVTKATPGEYRPKKSKITKK